MNAILHYDLLKAFNREYYRDLLTNEHVVGGQINIKKLVYANGSEEEDFWGYILEKEGTKYLLPSEVILNDGTKKELNLRETLPIRVKKLVYANGSEEEDFWGYIS